MLKPAILPRRLRPAIRHAITLLIAMALPVVAAEAWFYFTDAVTPVAAEPTLLWMPPPLEAVCAHTIYYAGGHTRHRTWCTETVDGTDAMVK